MRKPLLPLLLFIFACLTLPGWAFHLDFIQPRYNKDTSSAPTMLFHWQIVKDKPSDNCLGLARVQYKVDGKLFKENTWPKPDGTLEDKWIYEAKFGRSGQERLFRISVWVWQRNSRGALVQREIEGGEACETFVTPMLSADARTWLLPDRKTGLVVGKLHRPWSQLHINGQTATVDPSGLFEARVPLHKGSNDLLFSYYDPLTDESNTTGGYTLYRPWFPKLDGRARLAIPPLPRPRVGLHNTLGVPVDGMQCNIELNLDLACYCLPQPRLAFEFAFDEPKGLLPGTVTRSGPWTSWIVFTAIPVLDFTRDSSLSNPPPCSRKLAGSDAQPDAITGSGYKLVLDSPRPSSLVWAHPSLLVAWRILDINGVDHSTQVTRVTYLVDGNKQKDQARQKYSSVPTQWTLSGAELRDGKPHKLQVKVWLENNDPWAEEGSELAFPAVEREITFAFPPTFSLVTASPTEEGQMLVMGKFSPPLTRITVNGYQARLVSDQLFELKLPPEGLLQEFIIRAEAPSAPDVPNTFETRLVALTPEGKLFENKLKRGLPWLLLMPMAGLIWFLQTRTGIRVHLRRACPAWLAILPFGAFALVSKRRWQQAWWLTAPTGGLLATTWMFQLLGYDLPYGLIPFLLAWIASLGIAQFSSGAVREADIPRRLTKRGAFYISLLAPLLLPGLAQYIQRRYKAAWLIAFWSFLAWWPFVVIVGLRISSTSKEGALAGLLADSLLVWVPVTVALAGLLDALIFEFRLRRPPIEFRQEVATT